MKQVLKFLDSPVSNAWVRVGRIKLYVRKSRRFTDEEMKYCFDIANVSVVEGQRGKGAFTAFLVDLIVSLRNRNDGFAYIYVENVINPDFARYLARSGFTQVDGATPTLPSFHQPVY